MLEVRKLSAGYGSLQILSDVSLLARDGEITVIVGPNGSGKSTILKTIFGLTRIYSGDITFNGQGVGGMPPHRIAKMGLAYLPQVESVFLNLTVQENLKMASYTVNPSEIAYRVDQVCNMFPILQERRNRKSTQLSGGERQMLAMGMALIRSPKLIMFDEPTASLAPKMALFVLSQIIEIRDRLGLTIILVEQNARKALEIGDRSILMVGGRSVYEGDSKSLLSNPELGRLYLGIGSEQGRETSHSQPPTASPNEGHVAP